MFFLFFRPQLAQHAFLARQGFGLLHQVRVARIGLAECRRAVHGDDLNERLGGVLGQVGGLGDIEDLGRIGECGKACASCEKQATCG